MRLHPLWARRGGDNIRPHTKGSNRLRSMAIISLILFTLPQLLLGAAAISSSRQLVKKAEVLRAAPEEVLVSVHVCVGPFAKLGKSILSVQV